MQIARPSSSLGCYSADIPSPARRAYPWSMTYSTQRTLARWTTLSCKLCQVSVCRWSSSDQLQFILFRFVAKYCKRLYLDVTSTNQGKLTWNTIKPIIQGKILYTPPNADTDSIVKFVRSSWNLTHYKLYVYNSSLSSPLRPMQHSRNWIGWKSFLQPLQLCWPSCAPIAHSRRPSRVC